jgi:hypothetical protein
MVALASLGASASAQDAMSIGQFEFANSCVQCHGPAGKGDGPLVSFMTGSMPDITQLQKTNGGIFPVARVFTTIDGSAKVGAHGTSEMPAWGQRYRADAGLGACRICREPAGAIGRLRADVAGVLSEQIPSGGPVGRLACPNDLAQPHPLLQDQP